MRRSDTQNTDMNALLDIIESSPVCRLGLCENGSPYIVPMNFGYRHPSVYLHSAPEGRKIEILRVHRRVCFEVDIPGELVRKPRACDFGMRYRSVIGFGEAHVLDDPQEKIEGLKIMIEKYAGTDALYNFNPEILAKIAVIRIDISELSGKESQ